jgi:hypothetical protein
MQLGLSTSLLDFGESFIGHTYERQIHIDNTTELPGRFAIIPQDESSLSVASIHTPTPKVYFVQLKILLTLKQN